jgi:hypothetical protein
MPDITASFSHPFSTHIEGRADNNAKYGSQYDQGLIYFFVCFSRGPYVRMASKYDSLYRKKASVFLGNTTADERRQLPVALTPHSVTIGTFRRLRH